MLSEIKGRIRSASLGDALETLRSIEVFQIEVKRVYDVVFIHCASNLTLSSLNDLSTSAIMLEVEISEVRKFFPNFTEADVAARFSWISQDLRRIEAALELLIHQLWLSEIDEASLLKADIERLLE
ncbi:hypothetical protein [Deinococcus koreensis]|uniref:hypothetical protein n=1 Tax=Deinococcus koreensis TaxID=2054903 RepID=UPI001056E5A4|nr:hypothetical protein [Deinococcus koreensis]